MATAGVKVYTREQVEAALRLVLRGLADQGRKDVYRVQSEGGPREVTRQDVKKVAEAVLKESRNPQERK